MAGCRGRPFLRRHPEWFWCDRLGSHPLAVSRLAPATAVAPRKHFKHDDRLHENSGARHLLPVHVETRDCVREFSLSDGGSESEFAAGDGRDWFCQMRNSQASKRATLTAKLIETRGPELAEIEKSQSLARSLRECPRYVVKSDVVRRLAVRRHSYSMASISRLARPHG